MRGVAFAIALAGGLSALGGATAVFNGVPLVPLANGGFEVHYPGPVFCVELRAPCEPSEQAIGWTSSADVGFLDADNSGDDEAVIAAAGDAVLEQSFAGAHQAFSAHFDWFAFTIERGAWPVDAAVKLRLTELESPDLGPSHACVLTLPSALFAGSVRLRAAPHAGDLTDARWGDGRCDDEPAVWATSSMNDRIDMLRGMRIVEVALVAFRGMAVDDVAIEGATLATGLVG